MLRVLPAVLLIILLMAPSTARADVSGPACVFDGDTLSIGGRREGGTCKGGIYVRLFGIDAPELNQPCLSRDKKPWACGPAAGGQLLKLTLGKTLVCTGTKRDAIGRIISTCTVDGKDLAHEMARTGWAVANPRETKLYLGPQQAAQIKTLGFWQLGAKSVIAPWAWRQRVGQQ